MPDEDFSPFTAEPSWVSTTESNNAPLYTVESPFDNVPEEIDSSQPDNNVGDFIEVFRHYLELGLSSPAKIETVRIIDISRDGTTLLVENYKYHRYINRNKIIYNLSHLSRGGN